MSEKYKMVCTNFKYFEHSLLFLSAVTGCLSISAFASLAGIPVGITSSAVGIKICAITVGIKKYISLIQKKKKKQDKIVLLAKTKLNTINILISKALINSYINHDKLVLVNVPREYDEMKEEIKNPLDCTI